VVVSDSKLPKCAVYDLAFLTERCNTVNYSCNMILSIVYFFCINGIMLYTSILSWLGIQPSGRMLSLSWTVSFRLSRISR
jgi:hypothetical protein